MHLWSTDSNLNYSSTGIRITLLLVQSCSSHIFDMDILHWTICIQDHSHCHFISYTKWCISCNLFKFFSVFCFSLFVKLFGHRNIGFRRFHFIQIFIILPEQSSLNNTRTWFGYGYFSQFLSSSGDFTADFDITCCLNISFCQLFTTPDYSCFVRFRVVHDLPLFIIV